MDMVLYALLNGRIKKVASGISSHSFRQSDKTLILTFLDGSTEEISFNDIPYLENMTINEDKHIIATMSTGENIDIGVMEGYIEAKVKKDDNDNLSHLYLTDTKKVIHDLGVVEGDCVKNFEILTQKEYDELIINKTIKEDQVYIVTEEPTHTFSTWLPNHSYLKDIIVVWDGVYYITTEDYTSNSTFEEDLSNDKVKAFVDYLVGEDGFSPTIKEIINDEHKYVLELNYYDRNSDRLITITTPNLKANKVEIVQNPNNTENSFKVDINTYDDEGVKTIETSTELMPEKYTINPLSNNNRYSYKINIEKTKNDGTKEIKTSSNLKGNVLWEGKDLIGDEIVFEVLADDGVNYSRVDDLYINSDTNDIYKRTDKGNISNLWEKVGNIKGAKGNGAYQEAVEEGFQGTRAEWLLTLVGQATLVKRVWECPKIENETTELQVWYYYQTGENAWKYRITVPKALYVAGNYTYNMGTKYYNFTSTVDVDTSEEGYSYYYLADERNLKISAYKVNDSTLEETLLGTLDMTISNVVEETYTEVKVEYTSLGKWVQTMYIGSTKDNCDIVTLETGSSLEGLITTEEFYSIIGTDKLKTDNDKVKGAINEIFDMIKANKNTVLETTNKSLFEAVNELFNKHYMDCYELKDEDLLSHCLNLQYKTLSCNFIYAENCTNVPKDNNGYGYAMLIISQDTHYRQVIFFDPSNGKISTNNIGANATNTDFGNWSGWDSASDHGVPIGSIQAYYGRAMGLSIPEGWVLCDGSTINDSDSPLYGKKLPDLRGRVLAMANSEGSVGNIIGANTFKLNRNQLPNETMEISGSTTYTPSGTVSVYSSGSHNHGITIPDNTTGNPDGATDTSSSNETKRRYWRYPRSGSTDGAGYHSHNAVFAGDTATLNLSGSVNLNGGVTQQYISNMQATMYVDYIMKIK